MAKRIRRQSAQSPGAARDDLVALLAIAERGIDLQDETIAVLRACAVPGEPAPAAARAGGRLAGEYHRLWAWSLDFAPHADTDSLERRLSAVLLHHCELLHHTVRLAFPKFRTVRLEQARRSVVDLGAPGGRLHELRAELALWLLC